MDNSMRRPRFAWELAGTRLSSTRAWMQAHFETPLIRNGYSLVASTGMTSVLGLVYWVLAARLYTAAEIGLNAALISTMMALGGIAQLNLTSVLTRFLPGVGRTMAQRIILGAYAAGMAAALTSCALFLLGIQAWAPSLRLLAENRWLAVWFTAATMIWTVFSLQDGVLAGLRKAVWVPVGNTLFALAKIVLLLLFAGSSWRTWGPFASWTLPLLVTVLPVNLLIFSLLGRRDAAPRRANSTLDRRAIVRYFANDFLGTLFFMAAIGLAPVLVMERVGPEGNAVYYLTWTIAYSLYLVSKSMGISLVAEGAADPWRSRALAAGALAHTIGLLLVAVVVVVLAAPLMLQLFGPGYAASGSTLLRVLCLSALPFGFTSMYLGLARVEGRMTAVVLIQGALALMVLALGVPLLDRFGTLGMGVAWLVAQIAIALVLAVSAWRRAGWPHASIQTFVATSTNGARSSLLQRFQEFLLGRATASVVREATSRLVEEIGAQSWRCQGVLQTNGQVTVLALGPQSGQRTALMRIAHGSEGAAKLRHHSEVLRTLRAEPGLRDFCKVLPIVLAEGHALGRSAYVVEQSPVGEPGDIILGDARRREQALASAATAIAELHGTTAAPSVIDDAWLFDWIDRPIELIDGAASWIIPSGRVAETFEAIRRHLRTAWEGRAVALGWSHGNFDPARLRFSGCGTHVTGIADWSLARRNAPAAFDVCHLALTTRMLISGWEIGEVVCGVLRDSSWGQHERRWFAEQSPDLTESEIRTLVILTWLHHVAGNRMGSAGYVVDCLSTAVKIDSILRAIEVRT